MLRPTVSCLVFRGVRHRTGDHDKFFSLPSDNSDFVDVGCHLWREDGSVVYSCCWKSPAQSFLGTSPARTMTIFYCSNLRLPQTGGPGFRIYFLQEQGSPVMSPSTGSHQQTHSSNISARSLDDSPPYGPPRPVTGDSSTFYLRSDSYLQEVVTMCLLWQLFVLAVVLLCTHCSCILQYIK
jgi:hypothetical protein